VFLHVVPLIVWAWVVAALLMVLLWRWHLEIRNAAVVDVGWAAGLALVAVIDGAVGAGEPVRRWTAALMMAIWGGRLAAYLVATRVLGHGEDARYAALRQARGVAANRWFFWFFQAQGLLVALLSWPIAVIAADPNPTISPLTWVGVSLWLVAVAGESAADRQLSVFKAAPVNRGRTCRVGLWQYSRHPNYFFEWLVWVAYALVATPSPGGWLAWLCPALMLFFLFRVTGIPATEAQALKSRGDEYRDYQRTTSAFVPWFPRSDRAHV
jgi:steroid 5-alpha reductase family enzyme